MARIGSGFLVLVGLLSCAGTAFGQPSVENETRARALFKEANTALEKGDYASACPKFDAAMKLYPSPSTALNIAQCMEHDGKTASAWTAYQRARALNRDTKDPVRREAIDKLVNEGSSRLESSVPRVRLTVRGSPRGLRVTADGQEVPAASFGVPLPIDPGAHEIVGTADGYAEWRETVQAEKGKQADVSIALRRLQPQEGSAVLPPPGEPSAPPVETTASTASKTPVWAWVSGGVGLVALGIGAGFGAAALAKQSSIASACGARFPHCASDATTKTTVNALVNTRNVDRDVFIGLAAVGGAAIVAGIVGIATARPTVDHPEQTGLVLSPFGGSHAGGFFATGGF